MSELPANQDPTIAEHADAIRRLATRSGQDIIEIGRHLNSVKALLDHGEFGPWLDAEFGWTWQTANRFMRVAKMFGQIEHGVQFEAKALYALASDSIPEEVRDGFIERAEAGEPVRYKDVRAATASVKQAPTPGIATPPVVIDVNEVAPTPAPVAPAKRPTDLLGEQIRRLPPEAKQVVADWNQPGKPFVLADHLGKAITHLVKMRDLLLNQTPPNLLEECRDHPIVKEDLDRIAMYANDALGFVRKARGEDVAGIRRVQ